MCRLLLWHFYICKFIICEMKILNLLLNSWFFFFFWLFTALMRTWSEILNTNSSVFSYLRTKLRCESFIFFSIKHCYCCSVAKLYPTLCDRMNWFSLLCLLSPAVCSNCSNSCPLNWWYYLTISSSGSPFSFCLQSFPASGYFPKTLPFVSDVQKVGASASATVLTINIQGRFPSGLICLISLQSKGLSRVFSNATT